MEYPKTPEQRVADLVLLLDMEPRGLDRFAGHRARGLQGRLFGGQVVAQALAAAERTVPDDRSAHSLHAYFLRPGNNDLPIDYAIMRDFDGRSFSNRRVVATQNGELILNLTVSFQVERDGVSHQNLMPDVPQPEDLESDYLIRRRHAERNGSTSQVHVAIPGALDIRTLGIDSILDGAIQPATGQCWFRTVTHLPDDPRVHRAVLAYASDVRMLRATLNPHPYSWEDTSRVKTANLDHAIWFHDDFRADEWLLYCVESPWAGNGRGFCRGNFYTREGKLVASVAQEGMVHVMDR
ncbi:MAG: thioesterase family protein [Caenibius sp.]